MTRTPFGMPGGEMRLKEGKTMDEWHKLDDTIVAISTPLGQGGIGIVRLSGPEALSIADQIFLIKKGVPVSRCPSHTVHYGHVVERPATARCPGPEEEEPEIIDEALAVILRAPRTYTGEDVVEINCHGGIVVLKAVVRLAIERGARLADPGEFTKRAFLHGRIDLTQAEAVLDIIQSKTEAFLKVSTHQLKGELTLQLEQIREVLMAVYAELEALVNFPEEDIEGQMTESCQQKHSPPGEERPLHRQGFSRTIRQVSSKVQTLIRSADQGRVLKEGIKVVICGRPNVGKSSLLNRLLRSPRAIVSPIEGTTRDTIEETVQIQGLPFQIVDTAGILHPRGLIEEEAVKRSRLFIESSDLVLVLLDGSQPLTPEDKNILESLQGKNILVVINKCDLPLKLEEVSLRDTCPGQEAFRISALTDKGISQLETGMLQKALPEESHYVSNVLISNLRHLEALQNAGQALQQASQHLEKGLSWEFVSEELKTAVHFLDQITGRDIDADLLDRIFAEFCIGK